MAVPPAEAAARFSLEPEELGGLLASCREKLLAERRKRPAPLLDDKILTDWNGLMIAGLSLAGSGVRRKDWVTAAEKAARFIELKLREKTGRLLHRYRDRDAAIPGFLDDYAFLAWGLTELGAVTGKKEYVLSAAKLMDILLEEFADGKRGGFFPHGGQDANLFLRRKEAYDGAIPSGNAVAMANFIRLAGPAEGRTSRTMPGVSGSLLGARFKIPSLPRPPSHGGPDVLAFSSLRRGIFSAASAALPEAAHFFPVQKPCHQAGGEVRRGKGSPHPAVPKTGARTVTRGMRKMTWRSRERAKEGRALPMAWKRPDAMIWKPVRGIPRASIRAASVPRAVTAGEDVNTP